MTDNVPMTQLTTKHNAKVALSNYAIHENAVSSIPWSYSAAYDEVVNAIKYRGVTEVAIFGYSHGGGSTWLLADKLKRKKSEIGDFRLKFTAYIDALQKDTDVDLLAMRLRPPESEFHMNYYQEGVLNPFSPFRDQGLDGAALWDLKAGDYEENVDDPVQTYTHYSIDDDETILSEIRINLELRVKR